MNRLAFIFTILILSAIASVLVAVGAQKARSEDTLGKSGNDLPGVKIVSAKAQETLMVSWVPVGDSLHGEAVNPQR